MDKDKNEASFWQQAQQDFNESIAMAFIVASKSVVKAGDFTLIPLSDIPFSKLLPSFRLYDGFIAVKRKAGVK